MEHDQCEGEWNDNCRGPCRKPPYFSIEVHHGGTFCLRPTKEYIGGKVQTVHGLDTDYISLLQLEAMAQQLGYDSHVNFYYKIPRYGLDVGLLPIKNDKAVLAMLKCMDHNKTIVMYLEQLGGVEIDPNVQINCDLGSLNFPIDLGQDDDVTGIDNGVRDIKSGLVDIVGVEDEVEDDSSTDDEVYYSDHSWRQGRSQL
ncbi:hypothetical protein Vadar_012969 [Vaccinium darrowii]|uniref:Uncharacterized protein n=1 Tax=Vaccinium darrowii TaxID=229202 RepID=A0ACB7YLS5_9ERIC|nr:hypothetical protein Vadar_012969 [Vaccinium darrowii]